MDLDGRGSDLFHGRGSSSTSSSPSGSGLLRTFSLANSPAQDDRLELIVKLYPDGAFSRFLREEARYQEHRRVRVHGPYGQLKLHLSHRPVC